MDINGPGKSWKTHTKRSWKVMEKHFQCSVCLFCDAWPLGRQTYSYGYLEAALPFGQYQFIVLGEQIRGTLVSESLREAERPGLEPATYWLQIRCRHHHARHTNASVRYSHTINIM